MNFSPQFKRGAERQRFTAAAMQSAARQSYAVATAMARAAESMTKVARAAVIETRRQLAALRGSHDGG